MILTVVSAGEDIPSAKIAILVSRDIKPYMEAAEGLSIMTDGEWRRETFHSDISPVTEIFSLEKYKGKSLEFLKKTLITEGFDLFIAVGPEALSFVSTEFQDSKNKILYTMVLNPEEIADNSDELCGIPLKIPISTQIHEIKKSLPCLKNLGLLYDPLYNSSFFKEANKNGVSADLNIIPLEVSSKKDIPQILQKYFNQIDSLWIIPDRTVVSESIIQYIIKEAVLNKIPVIGYNRFFYESGAALAFVFDYGQIGRDTAKMALKLLTEKKCHKEDPEFKTLINSRVIQKLDIQKECRGESAE